MDVAGRIQAIREQLLSVAIRQALSPNANPHQPTSMPLTYQDPVLAEYSHPSGGAGI
jgi:hypothetical protein